MCCWQQPRLRNIAAGVGLICAIHFATATSQAQQQEASQYYREFYTVPSDGPGKYQQDPAKWVIAVGGGGNTPVDDVYQIPPPPGALPDRDHHLEVYSNENGTTFWTSAVRPITRVPFEPGSSVGGSAQLILFRYFLKDREDASLTTTITQMNLSAFGSKDVDMAPLNQGMFGTVEFDMAAKRDIEIVTDPPSDPPGFANVTFDRFRSKTTLSGWPTKYSIDNTGPLNVGITQGGTGQEIIEVSLLEPYVRAIDLSSVPVGKHFAVFYTVISTAIDTIQQDTIIHAFGRDPFDPDSGVLFTYEGLTPLPGDPVPPPAPTPVILSPVAVTENNLGAFSGDTNLGNMIDQSGLDQTFTSGETGFDDFVNGNVKPRADDDYRNYWQSSVSLDGNFAGSIDFDLGDVYSVDRLALWNGTLEEIAVSVAESAEGPWQTVGQFTLADRNPLLNPLVEADVLDFGAALDARYVRVDVESVYPMFRGEEFTYAVVRELAASVILDEALPGDFNGNGTLDAGDIDQLTAHLRAGGTDPMYDANQDGLVDDGDLTFWVHDLFKTYIGDLDLNNEFNSGDLVGMLAAGKYEVDVDSEWSTGDFNGDSRTDSGDLVAALADGGYELGPPPPATAAVPEPASCLLLMTALLPAVVATRGSRVDSLRMRAACGYESHAATNQSRQA